MYAKIRKIEKKIVEEGCSFECFMTDGSWTSTDYKTWEDIEKRMKEELVDYGFNANGIRIFIGDAPTVFLFRKVKK